MNSNKIVDVNIVTKVSKITGEMFTYEENVYEKDINKSTDSLEKQKRDSLMHEYIRKEIGGFFMYFYNKVDEKDIPIQYKTRFIYLSSFLAYDEEELVHMESGKGHVYFRIKRDKMFELLGLSKSEFIKTINILIGADLLYKDGKYYNISSEYSIHGKNKNDEKEYTRVFINSIRYLYQNTKPIRHKQLYYLFKLLPYVNKQSNILCTNVDEHEIRHVNPFTQTDLVRILGLSDDNVTKWFKDMRKFKVNDDFVIMKTEVDNELLCVIINPIVYYSGCNIDNLQYIIGLFDMAKERAEIKEQRKIKNKLNKD